jgi:quinone-modifying oxidoreductase subunit QmoB
LGLELPDVVTNHEFEKIAAKGKIVRPSDGKEAKNVVFIQSPGKDEDDADFEYAGSVTSQVALETGPDMSEMIMKTAKPILSIST